MATKKKPKLPPLTEAELAAFVGRRLSDDDVKASLKERGFRIDKADKEPGKPRTIWARQQDGGAVLTAHDDDIVGYDVGEDPERPLEGGIALGATREAVRKALGPVVVEEKRYDTFRRAARPEDLRVVCAYARDELAGVQVELWRIGDEAAEDARWTPAKARVPAAKSEPLEELPAAWRERLPDVDALGKLLGTRVDALAPLVAALGLRRQEGETSTFIDGGDVSIGGDRERVTIVAATAGWRGGLEGDSTFRMRRTSRLEVRARFGEPLRAHEMMDVWESAGRRRTVSYFDDDGVSSWTLELMR